MKPIIIAKDKDHLKSLIREQVAKYGLKCDLNHIEVSQITDMRSLFSRSDFNGDISNWDVSNVKDMDFLFANSVFNGNISNWNTINVRTMSSMFASSKFNGDISRWNTGNVKDMESMFEKSCFDGDISNFDVRKVRKMDFMFTNNKHSGSLEKWKPYKANIDLVFFRAEIKNVPYWFSYKDIEERKKAVKNFLLNQKLEKKLVLKIEHKPSRLKV